MSKEERGILRFLHVKDGGRICNECNVYIYIYVYYHLVQILLTISMRTGLLLFYSPCLYSDQVSTTL